MPPCKTEQSVGSVFSSSKAQAALQLNTMRNAIPKEAFVKNVFRSFWFFFFDYAMWFGATYLMFTFSNSETWATLPQWQQYAINTAYLNWVGFFMWCIFVVGHDCGHSTFSEYEWLNDIVGHITHSSITVPFYPWQLSHRRHHMYHNHVEKDYSHPWYVPARFERDDEKLAKYMHQNWLFRLFFPFVAWPIYLYGMPDGSHFIPFASQRLWKESEVKEYFKCVVSSISVIAALTGFYYLYGQSWQNLVFYQLVPNLIFGWWLVAVTYLQHHDPTTLVYDDSTWKFVDAAFETVDRKFGFGIDYLHHHITDGHVAHHLFFTKIPHYNLPIATEAIKKYLKEHDLLSVYREDNTWDFPVRMHKFFIDHGFKSNIFVPEKHADRDNKKSK
jgi:omega-3 fatty acid desaturase (delta-15 desaturase)